MITLTERAGPVEFRLDSAQAAALGASRFVKVTHTDGDWWAVSPANYVGSANVNGIELHVRPKTPIASVFFLLGYARGDKHWIIDPVALDEDSELHPAFAGAFARQLDRALAAGVLQGYHSVEEALPLVKGRIRAADQLRRRFTMPLPVEVTYDEFDVDTVENQLLKTACLQLLRLPRVPAKTRQMLWHNARRLADVSVLTVGTPLPTWHPTRLNARYHVSLGLAEIALRATSLDLGPGPRASTGFMIDMARLFEDFVTAALRHALAPLGGRTRGQERVSMDTAGVVQLRPDVVWYPQQSDAPAAVFDAKYKTQDGSSFPNADLYQMLAYCTALQLSEGHLVYAQGEAPRASHVIRHAGITIHQHALDLAVSPARMLAGIDRIAGIAASFGASCTSG